MACTGLIFWEEIDLLVGDVHSLVTDAPRCERFGVDKKLAIEIL